MKSRDSKVFSNLNIKFGTCREKITNPRFSFVEKSLFEIMVASWALVLHCVAAAVIGLLTIGSTVQTILRIVSKPKKVEEGALYEDKDGTATRESQDAYSIKLQNVLATLITVAGFGVALAGAVRATVEGKSGSWVDEWVQLGLWVCVSFVC